MLLKHFSIEDFKETFPLTSIGARVCYSNKSLHELLSEDARIIDRQKRAEFLSKLGDNRHFSVFAHSFVYKKVGEENALHIGATYFKSRYNPKYPDIIGISLRHYLEELLNTNPEQYDNVFKQLAEYDTPVKVIGQITLKYPRNNEEQSVKVYLLHLNTDYDGYAVFYIDGISRIATHQLIRHTALNFSQRSQRYVMEDDNYTIIPESIMVNNDAKERVELHEKLSNRLYKDLVYKNGIKREDARYFLPAGARTSIVVSGTLNWIYDFIEKRTDQHAQWEIRNVAKIMKELLDIQTRR